MPEQKPLKREPIDGRAHNSKGGAEDGNPNLFVQYPHPADEQHPYDTSTPGGKRPSVDIGPNPAVHNGKAPLRSQTRGSGSE